MEEQRKLEELLAWLEESMKASYSLLEQTPKGDHLASFRRQGVYLTYGHVMRKVKDLL
ncbi:MAG: hypothetical protein ACO395_04745 [Pontimonas sp.]